MSLESSHTLHFLFFPLMAHGHLLPMVDMAKLFAARGVKATILTTPANAALIGPSVDRAAASHLPIEIALIPFPSTAHGLPEGCENLSSIPSDDSRPHFIEAVYQLRQSFDTTLKKLVPDCVVTDTFLPWTYEVANEIGIPRLVFHGTNLFALCCLQAVNKHKPQEKTCSAGDVDCSESFVIPGLPHEIRMTKLQVPTPKEITPIFAKMIGEIAEFEPKSYGVVANSFYELEPEYVEYYRKVLGVKAWILGPLALCNDNVVDKTIRGGGDNNNNNNNKAASIDQHVCLQWLDSKSPGSVVYVCFGSLCDFSKTQHHEIALGLEASNHPFIWVVRKVDGDDDLIPQGFEERVQGRGLIIRRWAPQILILNHQAVGGFLTHCGWNSSLEGVSAGLPLITWPLYAEQFYNERLIVDLLKIGVPVGAKEYSVKPEERELIEADKIEKAVSQLMHDSEEATTRREKAKEIGEMARKAVKKGGSSYNDMNNLIQEFIGRRE